MKLRLVAGVTGGVLAADGVTKWWVATTFRPGQSTPVVGDLVRLTYVLNPGAAFGLRLGPFSREIFTASAFAATVLIVTLIVRTPAVERARVMALALLLGGALGNLVDRIGGSGAVVDFLDVGVGAARWPVFNLADVGVTTGAALLLLLLGRRAEREPEPGRSPGPPRGGRP